MSEGEVLGGPLAAWANIRILKDGSGSPDSGSKTYQKGNFKPSLKSREGISLLNLN